MENKAKKITKKEYFAMVKEIVVAAGVENEVELTDFIDKEIADLERKAEKAKERAAKAKAESDALREAVAAVLTDELQTADAITAQVIDAGEEVTRAKVVARLTQLVNADVAVKDTVKVDKRKLVAYRLV